MKPILNPLSIFLAGAVLLMVGLALAIPQPAAAQCGSSASSCKSCHETQAEDPVNTEGEWHIQHAFGDFCEFCHAGNVQAAEKEAAHQGLAPPMDDIAASCQGCHPQDLMEYGEMYASVLGLELGADSSSGGSDSSSANSDTTADDDCASSVAVPLGGEEIDFNLLYAEQTAPPPLIENWGNIVLLVMLAGLGTAFFLTAWTWEGWGPAVAGWFNDNVKVVSDAIAKADARVVEAGGGAVPSSTELAALFKRKPELRELWPSLVGSDSARLKKIKQILSATET